MKRTWLIWTILLMLAVPALACGTQITAVTPTPTKTPRMIRTVSPLTIPTDNAVVSPAVEPTVLPTDTPTPEPTPTDTPTPIPPTDTPTPEPTPTNTPPPPPPTPTPPPPTNTPAPPPPTPTPVSTGPQVVIELPDGDKYGVGDDVEIKITARDSDGVSRFEWGVFTQNGVSVKSGSKDCGNGGECSTTQEFNAALDGVFQIGVKAYDAAGNKTVEVKQVYVGG